MHILNRTVRWEVVDLLKGRDFSIASKLKIFDKGTLLLSEFKSSLISVVYYAFCLYLKLIPLFCDIVSFEYIFLVT